MMHKHLLYLLLGLFSLSTLSAQSTYSSTDFAAVGDSFVISRVQNGLLGLNVAATGANFSWNFDSLDVFDQETLRIDVPDNTGYFLTWFATCVLGQGNIFTCPTIWDDLTDHAIQEFDTLGLGGVQLRDAYTFYKKTTGTYEATIYGVRAGIGGLSIPIAVNYEDIDTVYQFPFNYLDKDSSTSRLKFNASNAGTGIVSIQQQKRVNEIDGWGSLTTPFASYPSVLRMKTTLSNTDTLVLNSDTISIPATTIEYKWFAPGVGHPVLQANLTRTPLGDILNSVEFIDSLRCLEPNASFLFFPPIAFVDSLTGMATVNFLNQSGNSDQFFWDFQDGTTSSNRSPTHSFSPGVYFVELIACNNVCSPVLCDTFRLPVTVINTFAPVAFFNTTPNEGCVGDSIIFNNNAINGQDYVWDFGDGSSSTDEEPRHAYAAADTYQVSLIAINGLYRDTIERELVIHPLPNPDIGLDTLFLPLNFSQPITPGTFDSYLWSTGDTDPSIILDGQTLGIDTLIYWVDVMDANDCMQRDSLVVIVTQPTSVSSYALEKVQLYPNPASDQLSISLPESFSGGVACRITDLRGKIFYERNMRPGKTYELQVDRWPLGFYLVHFEGKDFKLTQKFLVED